MIRNAILFKTRERLPADFAKPSRIKGLSLESSLEGVTGSLRRRLTGLMSNSRNEHISVGDSHHGFTSYSCACEFRAPRLTAYGLGHSPPFGDAEFESWVSPHGGWVLTFDAGRKLSAVATTLLSQAFFGRPDGIAPVKFDKTYFAGLLRRVVQGSNGSKGSVLRGTFRNITLQDARLKQLILRGDHLQDSRLFKDVFESSELVTEIGFSTAGQRPQSRMVTGRLNHWGGLTMYTHDLLPGEVANLVALVTHAASD